MTAAPGWFPDPSRQAALRWWDGTRWTEHTVAAPDSTALWHHAAHVTAEERKAGRWARIALIVYAVTLVVSIVVVLPLMTGFGELVRDIMANPDAPPPRFPLNPAVLFASQGVAPFQYGALIFMMIWVHRAATVGRVLHIPARRSPAWAVGSFFIPVVNIWWPCQSLRDLLPHEDPRRERITWTWIVGVVGAALTTTGFILAFFSPTAGWVVAVAGAALQVTALLLGRGVVSDVLHAHERIVSQLRPTS